jgi:hypothetical protein
MSEKKDKELENQKLLIQDDLFEESFRMNREKRSTLFYGVQGREYEVK